MDLSSWNQIQVWATSFGPDPSRGLLLWELDLIRGLILLEPDPGSGLLLVEPYPSRDLLFGSKSK